MRFKVTEEDIEEGVRGCRWDCPVARALSRALPHCSISVEGYDVRIDQKAHRLPYEVEAWIRCFDGHRPVSPFEFELSSVSAGDESRA